MKSTITIKTPNILRIEIFIVLMQLMKKTEICQVHQKHSMMKLICLGLNFNSKNRDGKLKYFYHQYWKYLIERILDEKLFSDIHIMNKQERVCKKITFLLVLEKGTMTPANMTTQIIIQPKYAPTSYQTQLIF